MFWIASRPQNSGLVRNIRRRGCSLGPMWLTVPLPAPRSRECPLSEAACGVAQTSRADSSRRWACLDRFVRRNRYPAHQLHDKKPSAQLRRSPVITRAIFGWSIIANAWRSASKRPITSRLSLPGLMIFSATFRRTGSSCSATYTIPKRPSPICSRS